MTALRADQQVVVQLSAIDDLGAVGALDPLPFRRFILLAEFRENIRLLSLKPSHNRRLTLPVERLTECQNEAISDRLHEKYKRNKGEALE